VAGNEAEKSRIGVLALQGDVREHVEILKKLGAEPVEVRDVADLEGLHGLIVPGGESTAIGKMMAESSLLDGVRSFFYKGGPVWGTCAGMVLAASATTGPRVSRNLSWGCSSERHSSRMWDPGSRY
jgi:pyridoxal 5'-phosphate synthase pdxT subunit